MKLRYLMIPLVLTLITSNVFAQSWSQKGFNDGKEGKLMRYPSASSLTEYYSGYQKGLSEFCIPENATALGEKGEFYLGVCNQSDNASTFNTSYEEALSKYKQNMWLNIGRKSWY